MTLKTQRQVVIESEYDTDYIRDEALRIMDRFARHRVIEDSDVTWFMRTLANLIGENERLRGVKGGAPGFRPF